MENSIVTGKPVAEQIKAALGESLSLKAGQIRRVALQLQGRLDLYQLVNSHERAFFWRSRNQQEIRLALGCLYDFSGESVSDIFSQLQPLLQNSDVDVRAYGGMQFSEATPLPEGWQDFGNCRFIVPIVEIIEKNNVQQVFVHISEQFNNGSRLEFVKQIEELLRINENHAPNEWSKAVAVCLPNRAIWFDRVERARRFFSNASLKKLVLGRQLNLQLGAPLNTGKLLEDLSSSTESAFLYLFKFSSDSALVGRTPELLYSRSGHEFETEAIAGTRERNDNSTLLNDSDKDKTEHSLVVQSIEDVMKDICESFVSSQGNQVLKLDHIEHLYKSFKGRLKSGISDADLLNILHPSPALGGYPAKGATLQLAELEPEGRGWFGAPVGWFDRDHAEFVVAIRSGLVHKENLTLFSGAGLVKDSVAEKEWQELNAKLHTFLSLFSLDAAKLC